MHDSAGKSNFIALNQNLKLKQRLGGLATKR